MRLARVEKRASKLEIRKGRTATVANQIREKGAGAKAEEFADVTGETRAEVAGAGADDERVDLLGGCFGADEGLASSLGGDGGSVVSEAAVQGIGVAGEAFLEFAHGEIARLNAVVAAEDFA